MADMKPPACECPTDDYCPKCHPRWHAKWQAEQRDVARVVGRDLSDAARARANSEGWPDHARMHPATAREYEATSEGGE